MPRGRYLATIRTRVGQCADPDDSVVVLIEVAVGDKVLAETALTCADMTQGQAELHFSIELEDAHPEAQVGLRVSTLKAIDAAVMSVEVARFSEPSPVSESVA